MSKRPADLAAAVYLRPRAARAPVGAAADSSCSLGHRGRVVVAVVCVCVRACACVCVGARAACVNPAHRSPHVPYFLLIANSHSYCSCRTTFRATLQPVWPFIKPTNRVGKCHISIVE